MSTKVIKDFSSNGTEDSEVALNDSNDGDFGSFQQLVKDKSRYMQNLMYLIGYPDDSIFKFRTLNVFLRQGGAQSLFSEPVKEREDYLQPVYREAENIEPQKIPAQEKERYQALQLDKKRLSRSLCPIRSSLHTNVSISRSSTNFLSI